MFVTPLGTDHDDTEQPDAHCIAEFTPPSGGGDGAGEIVVVADNEMIGVAVEEGERQPAEMKRGLLHAPGDSKPSTQHEQQTLGLEAHRLQSTLAEETYTSSTAIITRMFDVAGLEDVCYFTHVSCS